MGWGPKTKDQVGDPTDGTLGGQDPLVAATVELTISVEVGSDPIRELRALPGASTASSGGGWILPRSFSR